MTKQVYIRFYGSLNDLLPDAQRDTETTYHLTTLRSVKDLIESFGVPHTEVDMIIVDDRTVDFSFLLKAGQHISVYPFPGDAVFKSLKKTIRTAKHLQSDTSNNNRFVLDAHLGRLARKLRMLGFDALYRNDYDDLELATISTDQQRILLTCDRKLLMRKQVSLGYFVRSRVPQRQLKEILLRFDLYQKQKPFSRCMICNGKTFPVEKHDIEARLQPGTIRYFDTFYQCENCKKIYWRGSHFTAMQESLNAFTTVDISQ